MATTDETTHYGPCYRCGGTGQIPAPHSTAGLTTCPTCAGSGRVVTSVTRRTYSWPDFPDTPSRVSDGTG